MRSKLRLKTSVTRHPTEEYPLLTGGGYCYNINKDSLTKETVRTKILEDLNRNFVSDGCNYDWWLR